MQQDNDLKHTELMRTLSEAEGEGFCSCLILYSAHLDTLKRHKVNNSLQRTNSVAP